jgi:hypothetical protein
MGRKKGWNISWVYHGYIMGIWWIEHIIGTWM